MQYAMKVFEYEDREEFRVLDRNGEPWFILSEVCRKLGIANPSDAASRHDDDERDNLGITDAIGRMRPTVVINESGLYSLGRVDKLTFSPGKYLIQGSFR